MHDNGIPKKLIVLLTLILTSALVWADQKKTLLRRPPDLRLRNPQRIRPRTPPSR